MPHTMVGCKLPNGLRITHKGKHVHLNGANSSEIVGGHGLTLVDKDFFEGWLAEFKDFPAVKGGHIFAHENAEKVKGQAKERAKEKTGFDGLDPSAPAPGVKPMTEK